MIDTTSSPDLPEQGASPIDMTVPPENAGDRFDHFLVQCVPDVSRNHLIQSIRQGLLLVNGETRKSSYRLKGGERIKGSVFQPLQPTLVPQKVHFDLLFEDDCLLILSKPPGLVVHPASGNPDGTLVNGLLYHCREIGSAGDQTRPGIVHRLDKDTSGIMVVAKSDRCHQLLVDLFKARKVRKEYLALVRGQLREKQGRIVAPIARHPFHRQKMSVCQEGRGRYAASSYKVVEEFGAGFSLVRVLIETGRTHQIRVHMASIGHPVAGDPLYGRGHQVGTFPRQMLHSHTLGFLHPINGEELTVSAPLWPDFEEVLRTLRQEESQGVR